MRKYSFIVISSIILLLVSLSGCTVWGRFMLVNQSSSPIRVVGTLTKGFAEVISKDRFYITYHKDGDPYFRDTVINGDTLKVTSLAPGEEVYLGGCRNCAQDSFYLAFQRLEMTDTTGKRLTLPSRKAIYDRCSKKTGVNWISKLVYRGE
jgi:hypothetical protein